MASAQFLCATRLQIIIDSASAWRYSVREAIQSQGPNSICCKTTQGADRSQAYQLNRPIPTRAQSSQGKRGSRRVRSL